MRDASIVGWGPSASSRINQSEQSSAASRRAGDRGALTLIRPSNTPPGLPFVDQVRYFLRDRGEIDPVPILGGSVVEPRHDGGVAVYWRQPGPAVLTATRRRASLERYERLLRTWATDTELHWDAPEPHVACWIRAPRGDRRQDSQGDER